MKFFFFFFQLAQFKFSAQKGGNIKIHLSKTFASNLILGEINYIQSQQ